MDLKEWCEKDEKLHSELAEEYWKLYVGLPHDESAIERLENERAGHAKVFLDNWKEPQELFEVAVGSIVSQKTFKLQLKLKEIRETKVVSSKHKFNGKPVNWYTWRQFAAQASDEERKEVFDEFIKLSDHLDPVIKEFFETSKRVFGEYGLDPYEMYLRDHKVSHEGLKTFLEHLRDKVHPKFVRLAHDYSRKLFGREFAYYDDLYAFRNNIAKGLKLPDFDPVDKVIQTAKELGFSPGDIVVDTEDRPSKESTAFCMPVCIPTDVRMSYKPEDRLNDLTSCYHEYGHALHDSSISPDLPYETRYLMSEGTCETFSTLFEMLCHDPHYLQHKLGFSGELAQETAKRLNFIWTLACAFYCANSLFRVDYWKNVIPHENCDELYAKHIKACMGVDIPGAYWKLHHILPERLMYVPSYMLAEARSTGIIKRLHDEFGKNWWEHVPAGIYIHELMKSGADSPVGEFSDVSPDPIVELIVDNA